MPKELKNGLLALIICSILVVTCYYWVDKPVAFWAQAHQLRNYRFLVWFTHIPELFTGLTCFLLLVLVIRFCYNKWKHHDETLLVFMASLIIADFVHSPLKIIFGRYWPSTWINNNPSLLRDHVYGFNWFHYGSEYASFPSGHTCVTVAIMAMLWLFYPHLRVLAVIITLLVAMGLIGLYYHFVSDVIAGGFLGGIVAYYVALYYKALR